MRLPRPIHFQAILIWQDLIFTEIFWQHRMKGIEAYVYFGLQFTISTVWIFTYETYPAQGKKTHTYTVSVRMYVVRKRVEGIT
jgi:hypothetical protein